LKKYKYAIFYINKCISVLEQFISNKFETHNTDTNLVKTNLNLKITIHFQLLINKTVKGIRNVNLNCILKNSY